MPWLARAFLTLLAALAGLARGGGGPLRSTDPSLPPSALQIDKGVKVCTWPPQRRSGGREWGMADEAIKAHPMVSLVYDPADADFIIFVTVQDVDTEARQVKDPGESRLQGAVLFCAVSLCSYGRDRLELSKVGPLDFEEASHHGLR